MKGAAILAFAFAGMVCKGQDTSKTVDSADHTLLKEVTISGIRAPLPNEMGGNSVHRTASIYVFDMPCGTCRTARFYW